MSSAPSEESAPPPGDPPPIPDAVTAKETAVEPEAAVEPPVDDPRAELAQLWRDVLEKWEDDSRHARLIGRAQQTSSLGEVARLYKSVNAIEPGADAPPYELEPTQREDAKKRLAGVVMLATMSLDNERTDMDPIRRTAMIVKVIAVFLFVASAVLLVLILRE